MKRLKKLAGVLIKIAIGGLVGFATVWPVATAMKASQFRNPLIFLGLILGGYLVSFILAVALHELGHVLAGLKAGFRFAFMIFWPVQIRRNGSNSISVRPMFRSGLGIGGMAGMVSQPGLDLRQAYLKLLRGGPLASLAWGLLALAIAFLTGFPTSIIGSIFWLVGLVSLFLFCTSMYPAKVAGYLSDGAAIKLLSRGEPAQIDIYTAALELSTELATGTRPSALNPNALERIQNAPPTDPMYLRSLFFAFLAAADRDDLLQARSFMNLIVADFPKIPVLIRPIYTLYHAWLTAREGRPEEARKLLQQAHGGLIEPGDRAMAEAWVCHAEGNSAEARRIAATVPGLLDQSMIPDSHTFSRLQADCILSQNTSR